MDLQLTNIEHFSECDVQAKIKQLKVTQWYRVEFTSASAGNIIIITLLLQYTFLKQLEVWIRSENDLLF